MVEQDTQNQTSAYGQPQIQQQNQMQAPMPSMSQQQQMAPMPMVIMTPQLEQAKKDLHALKKLKSKEEEYEVFCPMCEHRGFTKAVRVKSQAQWAGCVGCACLGCWIGCCLIPFCIRPLGDTVHYCSSCNHPLGKKSIGGIYC